MSLWIPVHQTLPRHPKLRRCARELDVDQATVVGRLVMLWTWALDFAPDGWIDNYADLCDALGVDEAEDGWGETLSRHGFLDPYDDGWQIHDWEDYGGKATAAREARQADGAYGNHVRWHVNQNRRSPDCQWCESPPESPPDGAGTRRAEQIREDQIRKQLGDEPTRTELYAEAERLADERIAAGYVVDNREAYVNHLAQHAEVEHRARKRKWTTA
jgi:hypothetical protein